MNLSSNYSLYSRKASLYTYQVTFDGCRLFNKIRLGVYFSQGRLLLAKVELQICNFSRNFAFTDENRATTKVIDGNDEH